MNNTHSNLPRRSVRSKQSQPKIKRFLINFYKYVVPFCLFNAIIFYIVVSKPQFTIKVGETTDFLSSDVEINISSFLPVKSINAVLNSEEIELNKVSKKTYTGTVKSNGSLEICVENVNGMSNTVFEQINALDDTPPSVSSNGIEKDELFVYIEDSQSGIDYSSIYSSTDEGENSSPESIDKLNGIVSFKMNEDVLHILVKDNAGNESQITFSANGSEIEEETENP